MLWVEGAILAAAAPLLLFPSVVPGLTLVALILLVGGWLARWGLTGRPLPATPFNVVVLLWAVMVGVSILVSADPDLTWPKATGLILGLAVWRYLAIFVENERRLWLAVAGFIVVGAGITFVGVISADWKFQIPFVRRLFQALPPQLLVLPGSDPEGAHLNQLAQVPLYYLPLAAAGVVAWWRRGRRSRRASIVARAAAVVAVLLVGGLLLLTQSRSGWLGGVFGIGTLIIVWASILPTSSPWRHVRWIVVLLLLAGSVVGFMVFRPELEAAVEQESSEITAIGTFKSFGFRWAVWGWSVEAIGDFPFTGVGLGAFRRVVKRLYPVEIVEVIHHAHNTYLQVPLDFGLPGLVAYLALLLVAAAVAVRVARESVRLRPLAIGLLGGLAAVHVYSFLDSLVPGSKTVLVFWVVMGLLAGLSRLAPGRRARGATEVVAAKG